jgi:Flp pilus assembly pilin Flp
MLARLFHGTLPVKAIEYGLTAALVGAATIVAVASFALD